MQQYKRLAKNSIIFAVANFGSKIFTFMLVPYYTYVLSTSEYGIADTFLSTLSLILPFTTLYIQDAVMRFSMDKKWNQTEILSFGTLILFIGSFMVLICCCCLYFGGIYTEYIWVIFTLLVSNAIYVVIGQYIRGIGKIKQFAFGGLLFTFALCIAMPFCLSILNLKVRGFLLGQTVAYLIGTLYYILCALNDFKHISIMINRELAKEMIRYSLPLMPNAIMWWVMNASDRYMLIAMLGSSATGIYSVAHKIPSILNMITTIFFQAFQISAIEEKDSNKRHSFYEKIFNYLCYILLICSSGIIFIIRPVLNVILSIAYQKASVCVPFLLLSFVFSSVGSYYGTFYAVSMKTAGALHSTVFGAIINIIFNFCLIPILSINGAAIGTCIGMMAMCFYRVIDTHKYEKINYHNISLIIILLGTIMIALLFYWNSIISLVLQFFIIIVELFAAHKMFLDTALLLKQLLINRRSR